MVRSLTHAVQRHCGYYSNPVFSAPSPHLFLTTCSLRVRSTFLAMGKIVFFSFFSPPGSERFKTFTCRTAEEGYLFRLVDYLNALWYA